MLDSIAFCLAGNYYDAWKLKLKFFRDLLGFVSRIISYVFPKPYPVTINTNSKTPRGRVLFSYLENPLRWSEDHRGFGGHTNQWESREIVRIFTDLGYQVDAINWSDQEFVPQQSYNVCFDISTNLQRLAPFLDRSAVKILHRTTSDPYYQNRAELARVSALETRRNANYEPKRHIAFPDLEYKSMQVADVCSLKGNDHTLRTYPQEFRHKIKLLQISGCSLPDDLKKDSDLVPRKREFLWFFGSGVVHKGLDLLLEVFSKRSEFTLNIVGKVDREPDFMNIYHHELTELPNIRMHGPMRTDSRRFRDIIKDVFCFIAPSCSEGLSPAVVTCMQIGLYPLISCNTGITLPPDAGRYLTECTIPEIENAITEVIRMTASDLQSEIMKSQSYTLRELSRARFREKMENFLLHALRR